MPPFNVWSPIWRLALLMVVRPSKFVLFHPNMFVVVLVVVALVLAIGRCCQVSMTGKAGVQ